MAKNEECPDCVKVELDDRERKIYDKKYAIKLVEKIVFGFVTLILVAVASALIGLIMKTYIIK